MTGAQGRQTGTLRGSAHDSTAAVVPGVTVTAASESLQGTQIPVTNMNGIYEIVGLPNDEYVIRFTLQGFTTLDASAAVPLGGTTVANAAMQVGAMAEAVQVTALIPTPLTSTEISSDIRATEVAALPTHRVPDRRTAGVRGDVLREDFDGDGAIQSGVSGFVDFAHATGTEVACDLVRAEHGPWTERHLFVIGFTSRRPTGLGR